MLCVELLNVLHRLLLTRDSLESHVAIMSTVARVINGARDIFARKRTESKTTDLGEEELEPGKSIVFGAMETCMCLLSRYFPKILAGSEKPQPSPRLPVQSIGTFVSRSKHTIKTLDKYVNMIVSHITTNARV